MEKLARSVKQLIDCNYEKNSNTDSFDLLVNKICDILLELKIDCVKC